jgi:hypothetical protein
MKFRRLSARSHPARNAFWKCFFSSLVLFGTAHASVGANTIQAGALLNEVSKNNGQYEYTLTLENTAFSTSDIQMFWFGWEAGQADFLTSEPTNIETPAGWSATVEGGGADDGYSIQFVTFTTPLTPGSSVTFSFKTPDSPKVMSEPASLYPEYETLTSQVYSAHAADGLQQLFITQLVPASSSTNLTISAISRQMVLLWPTNAASYVLQTTTNLYSQSSWTAVTNIPSVLGTLNCVSIPATNTCQFFRLQSD